MEDVMKNRTSFGLSVADEKIKLIDILSEDDYFLVASPFCDHSLQSSISELERMEEKEKNLFSGNSQESRPSFLRRSLAWNSAFFNSSGVLDPEELFFINNGASETSLLPATHEVRNRRPESESESEPTPNDVGFSADWFELQPSIIESISSKACNLNVVEGKISKSGLKPIFQSSRKGDRPCKNKMKTDPAAIGKSINVESEGKMKRESSTRRASSNKNLSRISNLNMENKSMTSSSSNLQPFTSLSSAKFSPIFKPTAAAASTFSKRKSELKKTQNSAPVRKMGNGNSSASTHSASFCASPANSTCQFQALLSPVRKQRRSVDSKDVKEASDMQSSLQNFPKQIGSLSAKTMRPSGLRPPSPLHRFFDESTQQAERSRKMPQKNLKNPSSESAKRPETMLINTLATTGKRDTSTIDKRKEKKEVQFPADQLDNLCRNFEAVALKSEKNNGGVQQPSSRMASSRPCRRTPLADKTSKCNYSGAFTSPLMEPKKEKLARRASSVDMISQ